MPKSLSYRKPNLQRNSAARRRSSCGFDNCAAGDKVLFLFVGDAHLVLFEVARSRDSLSLSAQIARAGLSRQRALDYVLRICSVNDTILVCSIIQLDSVAARRQSDPCGSRT